MISCGETACPKCGGPLKYYDSVHRIVRTKGRKTWTILVERLRCIKCGSINRKLPEEVIPYKQYETDVIYGVIEGYITSSTSGFEDYPCELTMRRWIDKKTVILTWLSKVR